MERGVWGERGRQMDGRASRIWSNLSTFLNVFNSFLFIFFTLVPGVYFCAFWVPSGCKRGAKEVSGPSFWTAKVHKT